MSTLKLPLINGVPSPARKERKVQGTSNRQHHSGGGIQRICRQPSPREYVDSLTFLNNHKDQRHIHDEMNASVARHAPESHSYGRPPPLPSAKEMLTTMRQLAPETTTAPPKEPAFGMAAMVYKGNSWNVDETLRPGPEVAARSAEVQFRVKGPRSPRVPPSNDGGAGASSSSSPPRPTVSFLAARTRAMGDADERSPARSSQSVALPPGQQRQLRWGTHKFIDTHSLSQPIPGTAFYMPPSEQFDNNTRGLGVSRYAQEEKLKLYTAREVKTVVRRAKEAAVVSSRTADGERRLRVEDGRVRSKALQRERHEERMASYKFTA